MSSGLATIIKQHIQLHGPMTIEAYWNLCLAHPEYGYYITRDPLGQNGDFITAPEISQLFGEMIGVWVVEQWVKLGQPEKIHLVECGPGRGTLMVDLLRIGKAVPGFLQAVQIHLIETSPALREKQCAALPEYDVHWHDNLQTIPANDPVIIIGNEFLDALPIRQYMMLEGKWFERVIGLNEENILTWGVLPTPGVAFALPPVEEENSGKIFEHSLPRENTFHQMCSRVKRQGGAILMVDYGHDVSGFGDTFQAVKNHKYVDVLSQCGDADLTSHVDFGRLKQIAIENGLSVHLGGQGDFLKRQGIEARAVQLLQKASKEQKEDIESGLIRLLSPKDMGTLFRVLEVTV